jgi:hypothetical protein
VSGTGSGPCPTAGFGISSYAVTVLDVKWFELAQDKSPL